MTITHFYSGSQDRHYGYKYSHVISWSCSYSFNDMYIGRLVYLIVWTVTLDTHFMYLSKIHNWRICNRQVIFFGIYELRKLYYQWMLTLDFIKSRVRLFKTFTIDADICQYNSVDSSYKLYRWLDGIEIWGLMESAFFFFKDCSDRDWH